jgi:hypothetical protein
MNWRQNGDRLRNSNLSLYNTALISLHSYQKGFRERRSNPFQRSNWSVIYSNLRAFYTNYTKFIQLHQHETQTTVFILAAARNPEAEITQTFLKYLMTSNFCFNLYLI